MFLLATCDASNNPDPKDGRCQHCNVVQWVGGTLACVSQKLKHTGYGSPANEMMSTRWAAARIRGFRNLLEELDITQAIAKPTHLYVDNKVAVHSTLTTIWHAFKKWILNQINCCHFEKEVYSSDWLLDEWIKLDRSSLMGVEDLFVWQSGHYEFVQQ